MKNPGNYLFGFLSRFIFLLAITANNSLAYELSTHAAITSKALALSKLGTSPAANPLLTSLGLLDYDPLFGAKYFDISSAVQVMNGGSFEAAVNRYLRNRTELPIPDDFTVGGWVVRGAIREDDNPTDNPPGAGNDPDGVFFRLFGHFYDPQNNRGLTTFDFQILTAPAPQWALARGASVDSGSRTNHFTILDAREAMWRALTLKTGSGSSVPQPVNWVGSNELMRNAYWATTFRALGDVVHVLQDMAQPQHTRNDPHSGVGCKSDVSDCRLGHKSFYEQYIEARAKREHSFQLVETFSTQIELIDQLQLNYDYYPIPELDGYFAYFSEASNITGKGLANYTNRGFFSFGTNVGSDRAKNDFPSPDPTGYTLGTTFVSDTTPTKLVDMLGIPIAGKVLFLTGTVTDTAMGPDYNEPLVKLSSVGLWDQFLIHRGLQPANTLNYYNYNDQADLLIPRAVSYSAGLINYFFRGKLAISLPDEGVYGVVDHSVERKASTTPPDGFRKLKLKLANRTPPIGTSPQNMVGGQLAAVVRYHRNECYTEDLSGEWGNLVATKGDQTFKPPPGCRSRDEEIKVSVIRTGQSLTAGADPTVLEFSFQDDPIPINATDVYLQMVYRGPLGAEQDAVVVETVDINEPYFTSYTNATDNLLCVANTWYVRDANGNFPASVGAYGSTIMDDVKIAYAPGDATPQVDPLIEIIVVADPDASRLEPNQAIRFAVLAPLGTKWGIHWKEITVDHSIDHSIFAADLTVYANQVYLASGGAGNPPVPTNRAREMFKARNAYSAAGKVFFGGDGSSCDLKTLPEDPNPPPQLLPLRIMKAPFNQ